MIEAKIDRAEIEKLRAFFDATSKELDAASNFALKRTIDWLKSQLVKNTAKENRIQQKPLTQKTSKGTSRIWISTNKADKSARLWFGVRKISLARLNPKQHGKQGTKKRKGSKSGVSAGVGGSIFREGAFLMPIMKNNGESAIVPYQVMKRVESKRLPIEKQLHDYSESAIRIEDNLNSQTAQRLIEELRKKLQWQTDRK